MAQPAGTVIRLSEYQTVLIELGVRELFEATLKEHPNTWDAWLRQEKATDFLEYKAVMSGLGPMPEKGIGGAFSSDKPRVSGRVPFTLRSYGLSVTLEYEAWRWDHRFREFAQIPAWLARSGADRKAVIGWAIFNDGFATTNQTIYNGEALFATSHALLRGGTASNRPTPEVGLSYLGLVSAINVFGTQVNEDGLFSQMTPRNLITHTNNAWVADTLLDSQWRSDNANQAKNVVKGKLTATASPYVSNVNSWAVLADKKDLQAQMDVGDDLDIMRDSVPSTMNIQFSAYMSCRSALLHWFGFGFGTLGA